MAQPIPGNDCAWELWLLAVTAGTPGQAVSRALPKPPPVLVAR